MVTIKDIAKRARVSVGTVSNVLNSTATVREDTKNRVLQAIKELNYEPSRIARSLASRKTKTLGFIIPDIANPFFPEMARGAEDYAVRKGYHVYLCNSDNDPKKEIEYVRDLTGRWVDGIIIVTSDSTTEQISELRRISTPLVAADREIEDLETDTVIASNMKGAYEATRYLLELGHRNIAFICGPPITKTAQKRHEGYKKALDETGLYNPRLVSYGSYDMDTGIIMTKKLLKDELTLTAVFAGNDMIALGVIRAIEEEGLSVPEDISVIGFDDIYISALIKPRLTTVRQPIYEVGKEAATILIDRIEGKLPPDRIKKVLPCEFVIRDSVRKVQ